ncbi:uncharacterized protein LOC127862260 isoform X2 [Dreissena polymorpha]|nr:uncharacterized protein LOC127862260 isoform X2 [Dreissena polymorpha]XP_052257300.1 uncharacterized protein LOC127862260 isoform X2 [Dreissena polymorpha]
MTPFSLLIVVRYIENYKTHPEVFYCTDADPWLEGLELAEVWPICLLRVAYSHTKYELDIKFHERHRYFELTNTRFNDDLENTWAKWVERAVYLKDDPYGYVRAQFDLFNIPYPYYLVERQFEDMKVRNTSALKRADIEAGDEETQDASKKLAKRKLKIKMNLTATDPSENLAKKSEAKADLESGDGEPQDASKKFAKKKLKIKRNSTAKVPSENLATKSEANLATKKKKRWSFAK